MDGELNLRKYMQQYRIDKLFKIFFLSLVLLFVYSCKSATTEPVIRQIDENPPGKRDYIWTIDTVKTTFASLYRLWGSSSNDVWAIANGTNTEFVLWHYDGIKWSNENSFSYGSLNPSSIFGFSKDNLWIAGIAEKKGTIWHRNGSVWKPSISISSPGCEFLAMYNIWGESENDIYAVGAYDSLVNGKDSYQGVICHYDGINWQRLNIGQNNYQFLYTSKEKEGNGKYYILAIYYSSDERINEYRIVEFDGKNIKEFKSPMLTNIMFNVSARMIEGKGYFQIKSNLCRFINDTLKVIKTIEGFSKGYIIGGRNENDVFFGTPDGLAHFNGTDFKIILKNPPSSSIMDMVIFGDTVFAVASESILKGYFIKGVLKK